MSWKDKESLIKRIMPCFGQFKDKDNHICISGLVGACDFRDECQEKYDSNNTTKIERNVENGSI